MATPDPARRFTAEEFILSAEDVARRHLQIRALFDVDVLEAMFRQAAEAEARPTWEPTVGDAVWIPDPPFDYLRDRIGRVDRFADFDRNVLYVSFGRITMGGPGGTASVPYVEHQAHRDHFRPVRSTPPPTLTATHVAALQHRHAEAHRQYYHEPWVMDSYDQGVRWGALSALAQVLDLLGIAIVVPGRPADGGEVEDGKN